MATIDAGTVLQAITAAVSLNNEQRAQAEAALKTWEMESVPGFVGSLISIVQQTEARAQLPPAALKHTRGRG
eukprot:SAG11_NODE_4358_length_1933_cov_2.229553_2_plen_72_part_00